MFNRKLRIVSIVLCIVILLSALAIAAEPFKTKLNLFERLVTMGLLEQTGSFATLKIVTELNMMLAPTDEEYTAANLTTTPEGGVQGNWAAVEEVEFTFKEAALKMIKDALQKLDDEEKLTMEHFRVYEKFMIIEE